MSKHDISSITYCKISTLLSSEDYCWMGSNG